MKRIGAGIALIVGALMLVTPPAAAQNGSAWLSPDEPEPLESTGEIVLIVEMWRAGRVAYQTIDGTCQVTYSPGGTPPDAVCSGEKARAPEDYTATSGELVFTEGGSKTITIPIVDDDLTEGDESFTLAAWEEVNADPWIDRGDSEIVRIVDDESGDTGGEERVAPTTGAGVTVEPATPETAAPPSRNLQVALPASELRPGPGFELTIEGPPRPAAARRDTGHGSTRWWAIGAGTATLGVGALAMAQRRRRWSPTQA